MTRMRTIVGLAAAVLAILLPACGDDEGETTTVTETATPTTTEPTTTTGTGTTTTTGETTTGGTTTGEDVSGNCDEAEHADDPECSGGVGGGGRSGSNSGRG
jgi:hypothetical protein